MSRHGQLSQALLQDQEAGQSAPPQAEFLGLSDDEDADQQPSEDDEPSEEVLSSTPMIMGSPFPYLFQQHASKRRMAPTVDTSHPSSMEEGGDTGQTSKLVRELVHASLTNAAKQRAHAGTAPPPAVSSKGSGIGKAMLVGVINVVVGIPALISFTAIIFKAPLFKPYVGELAQLLFLASAVTQLAFSLFSSLPFAVGQTQDVGLIFLSAMATSVATMGNAAQLPPVEIVGTTLITCLFATLLVGICTILVGKYRLAGLVQYIPLPVVGGYLAYVGFFCLVAGASVSMDMPLDSWADITAVVHSRPALYMLAAAVCSTAVLIVAMERCTHPAALPAALVGVPVAFYAALVAMGRTLGDAQEAGWVIKPTGSEPFWKVFELYNIHDWRLSGTYWPAVVQQIPKMITLFFVVAFGSSMDVAAIQQDMPERLDFDRELITVGFTGSYIFSQTIFSKRQGVTHPANGWVIATAELALFMLPISVVEYMPNFFYGSLLMVFGIDISRDWLVHSLKRMTVPEYLLLLATFGAVVAKGLQGGIVIGMLLATCYFAVEYAKIRVHTFRVVPSRSGALRTFRQRAVLDVFSSRMLAISLEGYIFFGSALQIGERCVAAAETLRAKEEALGGGEGVYTAEGVFGLMAAQARVAIHDAPKFLLLDFGQVDGLDATAARTFGTIATQLHSMGIDLIITAVSKPSIRHLLVAHGAIPQNNEEYGGRMALTFPSMDAGAQFVEECFLEVAVQHGLLEPPTRRLSLLEILTVSLQAPRFALPPKVPLATVAQQLEQVCSKQSLTHGEVLFDVGDVADAFYVIESGSLRLEFTAAHEVENVLQSEVAGLQPRTFEYGPGGFVGDYDFVLQSPRSFRAVAGSHGCCLLVCSQQAYVRLLERHPAALGVLQAVMLRNACINKRHAMDAMDHVGEVA